MSETIIVPHKAAPRADLTEAKRLLELGMHLVPLKPLTKQPAGNEWNAPANRVTAIDPAATGYGILLAVNNVGSIDPDNWQQAVKGMAALGFDLDSIMDAGVRTKSTRPGSGGRSAFQVEGELRHLCFKTKQHGVVLELRATSPNLQDALPGVLYEDRKTGKLCTQTYVGDKRWSVSSDMPQLPDDFFNWWEKCCTDLEFFRDQQEKFSAAIGGQGQLAVSGGKSGTELAYDARGVRGRFNKATSVESVLDRHGYVYDSRTERYSPPNATGLPGMRAIFGKDGLWQSDHASDPLHGTFDAWIAHVALDHSGDVKKAIAAWKAAQAAKKATPTVKQATGKQTGEGEAQALHQIVLDQSAGQEVDCLPPAGLDTEPSILDLADRPGFVVADDFFSHEGKDFPPGTYKLGYTRPDSQGVQLPTNTKICDPLHIVASTSDGADVNYCLLLKFKNRHNRWASWAMPSELLASKGGEYMAELMRRGLHIVYSQRGAVPEYLSWGSKPNRRLRCVLQIGWSGTPGAKDFAYVLPSRSYGPGADGVVLQTAGGDLPEMFAASGSLAQWRDTVAAWAVGNPVLMTSICTAFAGPLLHILNMDGGGIHLIGSSSSGKSTALKVASSVWGQPDAIRKTWRATANGLEAVATQHNDSLLALDELKECNPKDVGPVVYMLGNGMGKSRATKTGAARESARFRVSVLSTGEHGVEAAMAEGGERVRAGQAVRLVDLPANRQHGVFDVLHGFKSGAALSDAVLQNAYANYGVAGPAFVERLASQKDVRDWFEQIKAHECLQAPHDAQGQVTRVRDRFAALALAGELATDYGVTGWAPEAAIRACGTMFSTWLESRNASDDAAGAVAGGNMEENQIVRAVNAFIEKHGSSRFQNLGVLDASGGPESVVRDRAGWIQQTDKGRVYLFTPAGLNEVLAGFDRSFALSVLTKHGILQPGRDGKPSFSTRLNGTVFRVYGIKPCEGSAPRMPQSNPLPTANVLAEEVM